MRPSWELFYLVRALGNVLRRHDLRLLSKSAISFTTRALTRWKKLKQLLYLQKIRAVVHAALIKSLCS